MFGRKTLVVLFAGATAVTGALLAGPTAIAQEDPGAAMIPGSIYVGRNYASANRAGGVEVCDMERDGNGVYGIFEHGGASTRLYDGNGSKPGCGNANLPRVDRFRVCEVSDGFPDPCSSWARP